jgi:ribosome-binding protein aMBF1 (putative translation factor)
MSSASVLTGSDSADKVPILGPDVAPVNHYVVPRPRDPYHHFGEWLRTTRDAIGMTQRQLSAKMGRPTSFIGKVETAQRRLDIVEFEELAAALGVSPVKLYERYIRTRE